MEIREAAPAVAILAGKMPPNEFVPINDTAVLNIVDGAQQFSLLL